MKRNKINLEVVVRQVKGRLGDQTLYPPVIVDRSEAIQFYKEIENLIQKFNNIEK